MQREQRVDFCKRAVSFERRVENVERSIAPAADRRGAKRGIAALADDVPHLDVQGLARERIHRIQQLQVARLARRLGHSGVSPGVQRLDNGKNLFGSASIYEVDCSRVVEHRVSGMQP